MKKNVTLTLNPITVAVEGKNDKELLANAKIAVLEQLKKQFPGLTYSINDADSLSQDNAHPGTIVEDDKGNVGIITAVNQKTINVCLTGHRLLQGSAQLFKKSNKPFEKARSLRHDFMKKDNEWTEGDTGYLRNKNELIEVVIGKKKGSKYQVYIVNEGGRHYTLTLAEIQKFVTDEKPKK